MTNYDLIIIGAGPAGLTAGIYAARARINALIIEKMAPGGQVLITDWVENYPGFPEGISGFDLSEKMRVQAINLGLKFETAQVKNLNLSNKTKEVICQNKTFKTKSLIIASGAFPKRLGIGEDNFIGKGLSFCATCDAPFYKNKTVVAVGGGDTAVQESIFLTKFAKKVYLVHRRDQLRATKILQERAFTNEKIEFIWDNVVTGFEGVSKIQGVKIKNIKTNQTQTIKSDGCFIWVGILPNTSFLNDDINTDEFGFITTDENMKTSVFGVFAAGDVRQTPLRQITTAIGDGATATISAEHYIENL